MRKGHCKFIFSVVVWSRLFSFVKETYACGWRVSHCGAAHDLSPPAVCLPPCFRIREIFPVRQALSAVNSVDRRELAFGWLQTTLTLATT